MKKIIGQIREYAATTNKQVLALTVLFTAAAVWVNYGLGLNDSIQELGDAGQFASWYAVFLAAFGFPYLLMEFFQKEGRFRHAPFLVLFLLAPAIFAWKMYYDPYFRFSDQASENHYWNRVVYFPFKLLVMMAMLFLPWLVLHRRESFYGLTTRGFYTRPYLLMLLLMIPLIAAASTQPDFLAMYPKLKAVRGFLRDHPQAFYKILFELSYGLDFVGIELFFRGFLVLAFVRWAGRDAILPMACFYCTIHFGKPLGECVSSFFGGMLLGIVTYHSRTILGGLMVHLGIAWLMELGGYLGQ